MKLIKVSGIALLLLSLTFSKKANAQIITVGDTCPLYSLSNVVNYTSPVLRLSDFKGKAIIVDFWNTYCTSCIEAFPKLDSLQQLFKDTIQIVLVNSESREKTAAFFKRHRNIKIPSLPMINGDTKLKASFPSYGQPYIVWIDKQGIVRNFSNGTNFSKQNLRYFIDGKKLLFRDPTLEKFGPAVKEGNFEYVSFISHCYETLNIGNGEIHEINNGKSVSIKSNCSSVADLCVKAFSEFGKYNFETLYGLSLNTNDSFKYLHPQNLELLDYWLKEHAYNYQLILPKEKFEQAYEIMQQDLMRYFDIDVSIRKKSVSGLLLLKDSDLFSTGQKVVSNRNIQLRDYAVSNPDSFYTFKNEPFDNISRWLKGRLSYFFPFADSTNYTGKISLVIRKSSLEPFNFQQFSEDMNMAGLTCIKENIATSVLFVEEKHFFKKANKDSE
jgi:thiol-disulfide isomerase/thioredoxin